MDLANVYTNQTTQEIPPTLYLIDGHAVVYRFHFAFKDNPLRTSAGLETSAAFGMAKLIATLIKNYPMTHMGVIWDPPCRTWRKEFFPEYKANRKHEDDISPQIAMAYSLVNTWGIYTNAFKPLEADDAIGILAKRAEAAGMRVRIVTKDKDYAQLVSPSIQLIDLGKSIGEDAATIIDREGVHTKFGVFPEQIVDYLSLMGDTSDNVPGVARVGKTTAAKLLTDYGSIEGIYENVTKTTPALQKALIEAKPYMDRNRTLVRLALNYQLPVELDQLKFTHVRNSALYELLESLELFSIIKILASE